VLRFTSTRKEVLVTAWICVPLKALKLPLGDTTVRLNPVRKPVPEIVNVWLVVLLVGFDEDIPVIAGGKSC
jgi:hypothetical protein